MSAVTMEYTAPPESSPPSGGRRAVSQALVLTHRHLIHLVRIPQLLLSSTIQPILFLILFNFMFGGALDRETGDYINFVLPGIVVQFFSLSVLGTALGVHSDISAGIDDRFRSLPITRSAVLSGRIFSDAIRCAVSVVSVVFVGVLLGFRFSTGVVPIVGAFLLAIAFGVALAWVGVWIGLTARNVEMVQSMGIIWVVPLMFISSLFVPTRTVPGWLQAVVKVNPLTNAADALRALTLGGPTTGPVLASLTWTIGILVTVPALAVRQYRRIE